MGDLNLGFVHCNGWGLIGIGFYVDSEKVLGVGKWDYGFGMGIRDGKLINRK